MDPPQDEEASLVKRLEELQILYRNQENTNSQDSEGGSFGFLDDSYGNFSIGHEDDLVEHHDENDQEDSSEDEDEQTERGDRHQDVSSSPRPEELMQAFTQVFGEVDANAGDAGNGERWISMTPAVIMRTVIIHGSLILTNHRLAFVALLPAKDDLGKQPRSPDRSPSSTYEGPEVIRRGPATVHFPGWRRKRTAWFELRSDSLVCYRDSTNLYNPVGSGRLSNITLMPQSFSPPGKKGRGSSKRVYFKGPKGLFGLEFYSAESANVWHKDLQAAIWQYNRSRQRVRIVVDLRRIRALRHEKHSHCVIAHVDVVHGISHGVSSREGNSAGVRSEDLTFGLLSNEAGFLDELKQWLNAVRQDHEGTPEVDVLKSAPEPLIEIEDPRQVPDDNGPLESTASLAARLVQMFTLNVAPEDLRIAKAELVRGVPLSGTLAISKEYLVFWRHRLPPFSDIRIKIPLKDIIGVNKVNAIMWHYHRLDIKIRAHPSLALRFTNQRRRDLVFEAFRGVCEQEETAAAEEDHPGADSDTELAKRRDVDPIEVLLSPTRKQNTTVLPYDTIQQLPRLINPTRIKGMATEPKRVICLTIGSRGDVQPYIALCKGLKAQGHSPVIVSHPEYKDWVVQHGIEFRPAGGDPAALMKLSVEHRLFSPAFFKDSVGKFRSWLDELLRETFEQCWDADLIIESPSTMAGIHVAEALQCFYFRAFTMPWTRTKYLPQAFSVPSIDLGEAYNWSSYTMFDRVFWQATSGQINRWRRHMLHLAPTSFAELDQDSVPFVYNFSPAVVPHPIDWPDRIAVTGYWFLDSTSEEWKAPDELLAFLATAREEGKKIVYIGFGSITVPDANTVTANLYKAVQKADVRAIVSKGWSSRGSDKSEARPEPQVPPEVYVVDSIPHDWLFPRIDVAMHHGGAGSTGASLRAGLVTLIHPFFGDQFFWAGRIQKLGAGIRVGSLEVNSVSEALVKATSDRVMREKAADVGNLIRSENGVSNAIAFIESHLHSSRRKFHPLKTKERPTKPDAMHRAPSEDEDLDDDKDEENDETILRDTSNVKRILSMNGLLGSLPHQLPLSRNKEGSKSKSPTHPASPESFRPEAEPESHHRLDDHSTSFFNMRLPHLPWMNVHMMRSVKGLLPSVQGEREADANERSGEGAESEAKRSEGEITEEREKQKRRKRDAKAEDERRRAAMEDLLAKRRELLARKPRSD